MIVSSVRLFRFLVVAAAVLHVAIWVAPFVGHKWLEAFDIWLLDFDGYGSVIPYYPILYWCLFSSWLLILAGLYFFVAAARTGLIILIGLSIGLSFAWGVRVFTPYEAALSALLAVIDGVLIAMAYWSSVRSEFEKAR